MKDSEQFVLAHLKETFENSGLKAKILYEYDEEEKLHKVHVSPVTFYESDELLKIDSHLFDVLYAYDAGEGIVLFNNEKDFKLTNPIVVYDNLETSLFDNFFKNIERISESQIQFNRILSAIPKLQFKSSLEDLESLDRIVETSKKLNDLIQTIESFQNFETFEKQSSTTLNIRFRNKNEQISIAPAGENNYAFAA